MSRNPTSLGSPGGGAGGMAAMGEKLTVKFANTPSHHSQKALQQAYLTASQRRLAASPLAFATAAGPSLHPSIKSLRYHPIFTRNWTCSTRLPFPHFFEECFLRLEYLVPCFSFFKFSFVQNEGEVVGICKTNCN